MPHTCWWTCLNFERDQVTSGASVSLSLSYLSFSSHVLSSSSFSAANACWDSINFCSAASACIDQKSLAYITIIQILRKFKHLVKIINKLIAELVNENVYMQSYFIKYEFYAWCKKKKNTFKMLVSTSYTADFEPTYGGEKLGEKI